MLKGFGEVAFVKAKHTCKEKKIPCLEKNQIKNS